MNDEPRRPLTPPWSLSDRPIPRVLVQPLQAFLHTEVASGMVLLAAALVALVWANSPARESYEALWTTELSLRLGPWEIVEDLRHWVNDLLMALFFFVVGLEIKRELVLGELRDPRAAALPMLAALGGMVVPALIYFAVNAGGAGANGWGIPMATDIAFAVGVLALAGRRAPTSLKVFLLTLAIVDDLGAIAVIAVFYTETIASGWLFTALLVIVAVLALQRIGVRSLVPYVICAGILWLAVFESGVHATIAGVVLGFLTPSRPVNPPEAVTEAAAGHLAAVTSRAPDRVADELEQRELLEVSELVSEAVSPLERLEHKLHDYSSFVVLPLFALANAGVALSGETITAAVREPVTLGVLLGLVLGKPLGVMLASFVAVRLRIARLPPACGWLEMAGVGLLAGIGFTVALFVAGLAFTDAALEGAAKVGILAASVLAGLLGWGALAWRDAAKDPANMPDPAPPP